MIIFSRKLISLSIVLFGLYILFGTPHQTLAACGVTSAKFIPSGTQTDGWFDDDTRPTVKIQVLQTGCAGKTLFVSVKEMNDDGATSDYEPLIGVGQISYDKLPNLIQQDGDFTVELKAGEEKCDALNNPDCSYIIEITNNENTNYAYYSQGQPNGELKYNCDGWCGEKWTVEAITSTNSETLNTEGAVINGSDEVTNTQLSNAGYKLLAPIGGLTEISANEGVGKFLEKLFIIMVSLAAVLAVLSLILAGFQYITTGVFSTKNNAKDRIKNSLLGLLLALGAFVILNTINPDLVNNLGLDIEVVKLTTPGDTNEPLVSNFQPLSGMTCPGNGGKAQIPTIANSFVNKVTYKMGGKGSGNGNTIFFDCSGFVSQVIKCAGGTDQGGTIDIFSGNGVEAVSTITNTTVNGTALQPGDLLGWKAGNGEQFGHVVIYVGNGKVMDSHGPENKTNQAIGTLDSTYYKKNGVSRIKYIRRTTLN